MRLTGGGSGIVLAFNNEALLAPAINESYRLTAIGNKVRGYEAIRNGILIKGVRDSTISGNTVASVGGADVNILVVDDTRDGDAHAELSQNNVISNNICGGNIQLSSAAAQNVGLNQGTYIGSSFKLMVGNGAAGGIGFGSNTDIYRDENNGDLTVSGGTVKLLNAIKLANNISTSRMGKLTATITSGAVTQNTIEEKGPFTVTGVAVGDVLSWVKPTFQAGLGIVGCRVSATNQIMIWYQNATGSPITPTSETYLFAIQA